jgi:hypothetical protein
MPAAGAALAVSPAAVCIGGLDRDGYATVGELVQRVDAVVSAPSELAMPARSSPAGGGGARRRRQERGHRMSGHAHACRRDFAHPVAEPSAAPVGHAAPPMRRERRARRRVTGRR